MMKYLLGLVLVFLTCSKINAQVAVEEALAIETVWENIWGVIQLEFAPDGKVFTIHKTGQIRMYNSITAKANQFTEILDIDKDTFSFWDHGLLAGKLHPEYPIVPYMYIMYAAERPAEDGKPFLDECVVEPEKALLTNPPDTRTFCASWGKLVRLKLDPTFEKPAVYEQELIVDWCCSGPTHHTGDLEWLEDGSLVLSGGDGAHFTGLDVGQVQDDCWDPKGRKDQGAFRAQHDEFLNGKIIRILPESLLVDRELTTDDYEIVARGARNPFRMAYNPNNGDLYFGDVGSSLFEEINHIPNPLLAKSEPNFAWPCIEGPTAITEIYETWARDNDIHTCDEIYAGAYDPPSFAYRYGPVDPDFPDICADADASVTGMVLYDGDKLPEKFRNKFFFVDYSKRCGFYFDNKDDGTPDFEQAHVFMTGDESLGMSDALQGLDGNLYIVNYAGGAVYKVVDIKDYDPAASAANHLNVETGDDLDIELTMTPSTNEWDFGDEISFELTMNKDIPADQISWRAVTKHCVANPCTNTQDCHSHTQGLSETSRRGYTGSFLPMPHPMESYVELTATIKDGDRTIVKNFKTHSRVVTFEIDSVPKGIPIVVDERTCTRPPCTVPAMANTNAAFQVQKIQAKGGQLYKFVNWIEQDVASGDEVNLKSNYYNEVAEIDKNLIAKYMKVAQPEINKELPVPENVDVIGGYMKADVEWENVDIELVDYIIIHLEEIDLDEISATERSFQRPPLVAGVDYREAIVVAATRKNTVIEEINALKSDFSVSLTTYNSRTNEISLPSKPIIFTTLVKPARGEAVTCSVFGETDTASLYDEDDFVLDLKFKNDKVPKGYAFKDDVTLSIHVETLMKVDMIINLLDYPTFGWHGGMTKRLEAGVFDEKISFPVEDDVADKELMISAILVPPGKDYTETLIGSQTDYIKGLEYITPAPATATATTKQTANTTKPKPKPKAEDESGRRLRQTNRYN